MLGWPGLRKPQQVHLEVGVEDLGVAKAEVRRFGGTLLGEANDVWWVFDGPAGHPFCLVSDLLRPATPVRRWCRGSASPSR
ncbi:VOC family protein [Saccharothrix sp. NRRL B-16348]|uniref:VOC family protein n=1 Tax=Saccharothrix sp. NRRL B-16348 TaxID=1415542 RepID=UPI002683616E